MDSVILPKYLSHIIVKVLMFGVTAAIEIGLQRGSKHNKTNI